MAIVTTFAQNRTGEHRRLQSRGLTQRDLDFKMITLATVRKKTLGDQGHTQKTLASCCCNPARNGGHVVHSGSSKVVRNVIDTF